MKILITDCDNRKAFDVYNIVTRHYCRGDIILVSRSPIRSSLIYGVKVYKQSTSYKSFENVLNTISCKYKSHKIVFMPIEENTIRFFYKYINSNSKTNFYFKLPEKQSFDIACDKMLTHKHCLSMGIEVPKIYTNTKDIEKSPEKYLPLIIKPRHGNGSVGIRHVDSIDDIHHIKSNHSQKDKFIQEKITNSSEVIGAFYLRADGKIKSQYLHKRIRTFPSNGGVTTFSQTTENEEVNKIGKKILESLDWEGLVMIEFLFCSKSKKYKIIEINPRLWGSILLSEFCGSGMIKNYIISSLQMNKDMVKSLSKPRYIKWIFPFEILNFILGRSKVTEFNRSTCYINVTYCSVKRSVVFHLFLIMKLISLKKLLKKIF